MPTSKNWFPFYEDWIRSQGLSPSNPQNPILYRQAMERQRKQQQQVKDIVLSPTSKNWFPFYEDWVRSQGLSLSNPQNPILYRRAMEQKRRQQEQVQRILRSP